MRLLRERGRGGDLGECGEDLVGGAQRTGLQVLHGVEGRVVPVLRRAADAVGDDPDVVVPLMGVGERVVHAHIGQTTDEDQRVGLQTPQHDVELGADEPGVPPLDEVKFTGFGP